LSQTDDETIKLLFQHVRDAGLDANAELTALLLKFFGEHRMLVEVSKEAVDRSVYYFNKYKETERELQMVVKKLETYEKP
jgi:hypothetical protein